MHWLALEGLSCQTQEGTVCLPPISELLFHSFTVVSGRNGAGKSVLGRVLSGLSPSVLDGFVVKGSICFEGGARLPHNPLNFSYLPQAWALALIGSTVSTDLELAEGRLGIKRRDVLEEIEGLGLAISGLESRQSGTLSRGEKQRVLLGVISAIGPKAVYFDEPDAFLDEMGRAGFCTLVERLTGKGTKVIVATHHCDLYEGLERATISLGVDAHALPVVPQDHLGKGRQEGPWHYCTANLADIPVSKARRILLKSLPIEGGKLTCLLGPNGSGKTTVLRRISSDFNGRFKKRGGRAGSAALVSDDPDDQLMFRSIRDEYALLGLSPGESTASRIREAALRRLGGMETQVTDLSWGMRRLLTILLAVSSQPRLLLIDEPQAGLDAETLGMVTCLLREATSRGAAVLVSSSSKGRVWEEADLRARIESFGAISEVRVSE